MIKKIGTHNYVVNSSKAIFRSTLLGSKVDVGGRRKRDLETSEENEREL